MKKHINKHWHGLLGKKVTAFLLCMISVAATAMAQRDTILFAYNEENQSLEIIYNSSANYDAFCIKLNKDIAKKIADDIIRNNLSYNLWPDSDNPSYIEVYNKKVEMDCIDWFDKDKIKLIDVYSTNNTIRDNYSTNFQGYVLEASRCIVETTVEKASSKPANKADESQSEAAKSEKTAGFPYWIVAFIVLLAVGAALFLLRNKLFVKRKPKEDKPQTSSNSALEIVEEVSTQYIANLDYVRQSPGSYFTMDMQKDFADTAVHKIFIHHTAVKKMYDFFKKELENSTQTNETGCYFIGCWEHDDPENKTYNISVEDIIEPGDDIVPGEFSFNFGLKIGVKLFARIADLTKTTNRDFVHTVWMHSHPGLGLFLSSHDLLVQKQLTYSDAPNRLVAFVIDTNTPEWDLAVFTAKTNGDMNNKEELKRLYSLESLYKWSRTARATEGESHQVMVEQAKEEHGMENYYLWQVNHQGNSKTTNAYISGRAINAIDDILYTYAGKQAVGGYMAGRIENKGNLSTIIIEDCPQQETTDSIGPIVVDSKIQDSDIQAKFQNKTTHKCLMVFKKEDEILVLIRDNANQPFPPLSSAAKCPIKPMKDWLHRKRIYK